MDAGRLTNSLYTAHAHHQNTLNHMIEEVEKLTTNASVKSADLKKLQSSVVSKYEKNRKQTERGRKAFVARYPKSIGSLDVFEARRRTASNLQQTAKIGWSMSLAMGKICSRKAMSSKKKPDDMWREREQTRSMLARSTLTRTSFEDLDA